MIESSILPVCRRSLDGLKLKLVVLGHFVLEAFLGAARTLPSVLSGASVPERVWFPRCGAKPSWRDDRGDSPSVLFLRLDQ